MFDDPQGNRVIRRLEGSLAPEKQNRPRAYKTRGDEVRSCVSLACEIRSCSLSVVSSAKTCDWCITLASNERECSPNTPHRHGRGGVGGGVEVWLHSFLPSALDWVGLAFSKCPLVQKVQHIYIGVMIKRAKVQTAPDRSYRAYRTSQTTCSFQT